MTLSDLFQLTERVLNLASPWRRDAKDTLTLTFARGRYTTNVSSDAVITSHDTPEEALRAAIAVAVASARGAAARAREELEECERRCREAEAAAEQAH